MEKKASKIYESFYVEPFELPTFDEVTKDVSSVELKELFGSGSTAFYAEFLLKKYYNTIKQGLRDGVPNATGSLSKGLVGDAIAYLNSRDAKDYEVSQKYFQYFFNSNYILGVLKEYFTAYLGFVPTNFDNSVTQNSIVKYFTQLNQTGYRSKLEEVLKAVVAKQNPFLPIDKINEIVTAGIMNTSTSSETTTQGPENKNTTKTTRISPLFIGILILVGLIIFKKTKKA